MALLPDRLMPREMFGPTEGITSPNRRFTLQLGTDNVLRIFCNRSARPRATVWASPAAAFTVILCTMRDSGQLALEGASAGQEMLFPPDISNIARDIRFSTAVMRDDGILRIVDQSGDAVWNSPDPGRNIGPNGAGDFLEPGEQLSRDRSLFSQSGEFELAYQSDGNLVLYKHIPAADRGVLWASDTSGRDADRCVMSSDGVLRLIDRDEIVYWQHKVPRGRSAYFSRLKLYNSGLLRIESPNRHVMWRAPVAMSTSPGANSIAVISSPSSIEEEQRRVEARVVLHRLSNTNGSDPVRLTPAQMTQWVDEANRVLEPAKLRLRFDPATDVFDVRNTRLNRINPGARARNDVYAVGDAELISRAQPDVLHVIARSSRPPDGSGGDCGVGCGFSWWTLGQVFVPHFDPNFVGILAHEFGHHLGLPHTMTHVIDTLRDAQLLFRLANPRAAEFDGDAAFVTDTPPDMFIGSESPGTNTQIMLGGKTFQYLRSNIMSYYATLPMQQKTITISQAVRIREIMFRRSKRGVTLTPV